MYRRILNHLQIGNHFTFRTKVTKVIFNKPVPVSTVNKNRQYDPEYGYSWKSGYNDIQWPKDMTIDQFVWHNVTKWQNKIAIECTQTQRRYTYAKLRDACAAFAIRLQTHYKLIPGDVVALVLNNIPEYPIGVLGTIEAGLTVTTLNPAFTINELATQFSSCEPKIILTIPHCYANVQKACEMCKLSAKIIVVRTDEKDQLPIDAIDFYQLIDSNGIDFSDLKTFDRHPSDICLLPYSSGTTGLPKGVMLSHSNLVSNVQMYESPLPDERLMRDTTSDCQDQMLSVLPLFHLAGLLGSIIPKLTYGIKIVVLPTFTIDQFMASLLNYPPHVMAIVPSIFMMLANHPSISIEHLKQLRSIVCGASSIGEADVEKLIKKKPNLDFVQAYGMTETSAIAFLSPKNGKNYKTVGWPVPCTELKICKPNDSSAFGLDVDEIGEVYIRGPSVMRGYYRNEQATNELLLPDGWLRTGDAGYYDQNGFLYVTDRLKDIIKVNSYQVAPAELEAILRTHPAILDAGVVGIEHAQSGEVPRAYVVCQPNVNRPTEKEIIDFVNAKVVAYKRLDGGVQFLSALPKNTTGKVLRRELKLL